MNIKIKEGEEIITEIRDLEGGEPVRIVKEKGRIYIKASNEGGYNGTMVDLSDVMKWVENNRDL